MSDSENDSVHTPTQSEFATFEVLANRDYTNMSKKKPRRSDLRKSFPVDVVEEDDEENDEREEVEQEEEKPVSVAESIHSLAAKEEDDEEENVLNEVESNHDSPIPIVQQQTSTQSYTAFTNTQPSFQAPSHQPPSDPPHTQTSNRKYMDAVEAERRDEKEGLLSELLSLAQSGQCKLARALTMKDSLEEISFQYDRCQSEMEAKRMVGIAKSSIDVGSNFLEMMAKNFGFQLLDGYHKSLCSDMNRFDRPLTKLYKKYWRRGSQKPEMELAMIVIGSFGWTIMSNMMKDGTYLKKFFGGNKKETKSEDDVEAIKARFSTTSPASTPPASPGNSKRSMRPPSMAMNMTPPSPISAPTPWKQVSSKPQIEIIDEEASKSALQSIKLKEIEMEKRMERIQKMEEEFSKRLLIQQQQLLQMQQPVQQQQPIINQDKTIYNRDDDEDEHNETEEDESETEDRVLNESKRVIVMSTPIASGRKSGRKGGIKQPVMKL